jgi:hypothetical protein
MRERACGRDRTHASRRTRSSSPTGTCHEQRLDEHRAPRIAKAGRPDTPCAFRQLHEDFHARHTNADIAATLSETQERMVRYTDQVAQKLEDKKFELPSAVRDDLEDLLQPYHDGLRDKMLGELPIETRRDVEAAKRRLEEDE